MIKNILMVGLMSLSGLVPKTDFEKSYITENDITIMDDFGFLENQTFSVSFYDDGNYEAGLYNDLIYLYIDTEQLIVDVSNLSYFVVIDTFNFVYSDDYLVNSYLNYNIYVFDTYYEFDVISFSEFNGYLALNEQGYQQIVTYVPPAPPGFGVTNALTNLFSLLMGVIVGVLNNVSTIFHNTANWSDIMVSPGIGQVTWFSVSLIDLIGIILFSIIIIAVFRYTIKFIKWIWSFARRLFGGR